MGYQSNRPEPSSPDPRNPAHPLERPYSRPAAAQPPAAPDTSVRRLSIPQNVAFLTYAIIALNGVILIVDFLLNGQLTNLGEKLNELAPV